MQLLQKYKALTDPEKMVGKRIEFFYLCIIWNYNE